MPSKTQSILLSGVIVGIALAIFQFIPVVGGCLCILAVLGVGMLAVWHYANTYEWTVPGGTGAGMGALAGVVAAIVDGIIGFFLTAAGVTLGPQEAIRRALEGMEAGGMPPEQLEAARQILESTLFVPAMYLCEIVIFAVLGALGGVIGASLFKFGDETASRQQRGGRPRDPREGDTGDQDIEADWRSE